MRGGLIRNYHQVKVMKEFSNVPDADIWFHGLSNLPKNPFPQIIQEQLDKFKGKIVFFQNDDSSQINIDKIPQSLITRTTIYLRNVWPSDPQLIHSSVCQKRGLLNPMVKPDSARAGKNLKFREHKLSFYGAASGGTKFNRLNALQIIKDAQLPFLGGIFKRPEYTADIPEHFAVDILPLKVYKDILGNTQVSLVLHGDNPLTFRLFESFSCRCLVIAQDMSEISFADCGLKDGVHYVCVKKDLSDLVERILYFQNHLDDAQAIADAGFNHFKKYFQFNGVNMTQPLFNEITKTWTNLNIPQGQINPFSLAKKWALPFIHSL
jgi:hypothetical protein